MPLVKCEHCGNEEAHRIQIRYINKGQNQDPERIERCNKCGDMGNSTIPDVYWRGTEKNPNITDRMGKPIELRSRRHKAEVMRQLGYSEAGDFHRGGRIGRR